MKFDIAEKPLTVLGTYRTVCDALESEAGYFVTTAVSELQISTEGIVGDRHFGNTRLVRGRGKQLYEPNDYVIAHAGDRWPGIVIRNNRQWSAISQEELDGIAQKLDLERTLTPELVGANFLLSGNPHLSQLPGLTYLVFSPRKDFFAGGRAEDSTLVVYGQAAPCTTAGQALVAPYGSSSLENRFPKAAYNHRGLVGWIESPVGRVNIIKPGDCVWVLTPNGVD